MDFQKDYLSRALWIREILLDIEMIKLYENAGIYPMHGESCNDFFRECEYMNLCTLSTDKLTDPLRSEDVIRILDSNHGDFEINLSLNDLIMSQLDKEIQVGNQVTDTRQCNDCMYRRETNVFVLCANPASEYEIAGKVDLHTTGHMIRIQANQCKHHSRKVMP